MFFRWRPGGGLFRLLLLLLGIKVIRNSRLSEEERAAVRAKARKFRSKMREACAVWDEDGGCCRSDVDEAQQPNSAPDDVTLAGGQSDAPSQSET